MKKISLIFCLLLLMASIASSEDGDAMNVTLLSSVNDSNEGIIHNNHYIYVSGAIYDVIDPTSPIFIEGIGGSSFDIRGSLIFSERNEDLGVHDISNPETPELISTYNSRHSIYNLVVRENYAFIADFNGFGIIDVSNLQNISEESYIEVSDYNLFEIAVSGNYAYLLSSDDLYIYDVSDPTSPSLVGNCDHGGASEAIAISGNFAFVGDYGYMGVIDISNPENPILSESWVGGGAMKIKIMGNYAYMASSYAGVTIANISDPFNMIVVGFYDTPGRMTTLDVNDNIIYATGDEYVHILDCSAATDDSPPDAFNLLTPANNTTIADDEVNLTWSESSDDVYKYVLYTATNSSFTQNVDSVDVDAEDTEYTFDDLENNTTYWWKVRAQNANSAGTWSSQTWSFAIQQSDVPEHGQLPQEYAVTAVYPNPFNPTFTAEVSLPLVSELRITVYNMLGEEVGNLANGVYPAGYQRFEFDGSSLSSGVYFLKAVVPGKLHHTEKVVLMK